MSDQEITRINKAIRTALTGFHAPRRHPCEVTADRLGDHLDRYPEAFDGATRDDIGHLRHILQDIAESERA